MEEYIRISTLNDFIFCPKSIYFHGLYSRYHVDNYKDEPQVSWTMSHESIDNRTYTTSRQVLQSLEVFSDKYGLIGKIDTYYIDKKILLERKTKVTRVYIWYIYQLYAQYFCMIEMWYEIDQIKIRSKKDNKIYDIPLPDPLETTKFETFLKKYRDFDIDQPNFTQNPKKCARCIYRELCDYYINLDHNIT